MLIIFSKKKQVFSFQLQMTEYANTCIYEFWNLQPESGEGEKEKSTH